VRKGIPFRQAHDLVGRAVRMAEAKNASLRELSTGEINTISDAFPEELQQVFYMGAMLNRRASVGGVAALSLQEHLDAARTALA